MLRLNLMYQFSVVLCHVRELPTIALAHVLTESAEPDCLFFKVIFLFLCQMSVIEVVRTPPVIISFSRACEVAKAQA